MELDLLISGSPVIDVADWKAQTDYWKKDNPQAEQIVAWFWDYMENHMTNEQLSSFLLFCTGSARPPATGFKDLSDKFTINIPRIRGDGYFHSHSCFNRFDMPITSRQDLERNILIAVNLSTGFDER